jgi:hypothetical protein
MYKIYFPSDWSDIMHILVLMFDIFLGLFSRCALGSALCCPKVPFVRALAGERAIGRRLSLWRSSIIFLSIGLIGFLHYPFINLTLIISIRDLKKRHILVKYQHAFLSCIFYVSILYLIYIFNILFSG